MLTTIAKRIQSRLSRQGVKVVLGEIKEQCDRLIPNIENPTKNDILTVVNYFISNATNLTVISKDVEELETNKAALEQETLTNNNSEELTPETSICVGGENGNISTSPQTEPETFTSEVDRSIQPVDSHQDDIYTTGIDTVEGDNSYPITADQDTEESALTTATKPELVSTTAQSMGIVLDVGEISLIAENVGQSTDSLDQDIDAIKSAIMAFVKHKAAISQQKINNMISEVREVVSTNNTQNSQQLTDGLRQINSDIQEGNKQFKSNVRTALKAFAIPAIK
ncbi:hypothetical protein VB713_13485, partial [Anabaena cylindrica UHCC 0172]|uniref:hypothetical protein n=1 Tax=Anabaena cylindrica TaxID=1165 RepID=UPI002B213C73